MLSAQILVCFYPFYEQYVLSDSEYYKAGFLSFISGITEYTVNGVFFLILPSRAINQHLLTPRHCNFGALQSSEKSYFRFGC